MCYNLIYTYTCDIHVVRTKFVGPFALMDSQPTVTTTPSSNSLIRTPLTANSFGNKRIHVCYTLRVVVINDFLTLLLYLFIESPTRVALNTSDTVRLSRTTSNGLEASFEPATPVNDTRTQQFPVSDVSNGKFLKTTSC